MEFRLASFVRFASNQGAISFCFVFATSDTQMPTKQVVSGQYTFAVHFILNHASRAVAEGIPVSLRAQYPCPPERDNSANSCVLKSGRYSCPSERDTCVPQSTTPVYPRASDSRVPQSAIACVPRSSRFLMRSLDFSVSAWIQLEERSWRRGAGGEELGERSWRGAGEELEERSWRTGVEGRGAGGLALRGEELEDWR